MPSVSTHLGGLKASGKKALVLFVTAGDQPLEELPDLLGALQEGGADLIEVGVPFSDPYGEGLTIQASSQRSLARGTTSKAIIAALGTVRLDIPLVTMGYYNTVLRSGVAAFASDLRAAGVGGAIIQDLVPEESDLWCLSAKENELETIFLAAPTSTEARLNEVCTRSTGFIYAISRTGVTGAGQAVPPEVGELVGKIKARTDKPVCVGFGVSTPDHVRMVCQTADGAVVGSALVDFLHKTWDGGAGRAALVEKVRDWKAACV